MGRREREKVNEETGGCASYEVFEGDKEKEACRGLCVHDSMCVWSVCASVFIYSVFIVFELCLSMHCSPSIYL